MVDVQVVDAQLGIIAHHIGIQATFQLHGTLPLTSGEVSDIAGTAVMPGGMR